MIFLNGVKWFRINNICDLLQKKVIAHGEFRLVNRKYLNMIISTLPINMKNLFSS